MINAVMLVKDRPELTKQAIETMFLNGNLDDIRLTVVDDGSRSVTRDILRDYTSHGIWKIAVIRVEPSRKITGLVRNIGVYFSEQYWGRGEFLYLADNDSYFLPGWLDVMLKAWSWTEQNGFVMIGGYTHPYHGSLADLTISEGLIIQEHHAIGGLSQMMRWATWDKYGPLDAHSVGVCQSEDWAFAQKIRKDGLRVGALRPRQMINCGLTNSYGAASVGREEMVSEASTQIAIHGLEGKVVLC